MPVSAVLSWNVAYWARSVYTPRTVIFELLWTCSSAGIVAAVMTTVIIVHYNGNYAKWAFVAELFSINLVVLVIGTAIIALFGGVASSIHLGPARPDGHHNLAFDGIRFLAIVFSWFLGYMVTLFGCVSIHGTHAWVSSQPVASGVTNLRDRKTA